MFATITENISPSIRSNIPPCPGKIFPVSFIFSNLLKYETKRSPICEANEKIIARIKYFILKIKLKFISNNKLIIIPNKKTDNKEKTNDPRTPDNVFFGLIFVKFFHLKYFPKKYPPISELIVNIIIQISKINDDVVSFLK